MPESHYAAVAKGATISIHIIAGERRGHKLEGLPRQARPTSNLVRESVFNILSEYVVDRPVFDLFAGTGALGLEALSRGAARATFVERDRGTLDIIRRNIAHLRYEDRTTVVGSDAYRWFKGSHELPAEPVVVLLDPPYRDYEQHPRKLGELLNRLVLGLVPGSVVVVEGPEHAPHDLLPPGVEWDRRLYGGTWIAFYGLMRGGPPADPGDPDADDGPRAAEDQ